MGFLTQFFEEFFGGNFLFFSSSMLRFLFSAYFPPFSNALVNRKTRVKVLYKKAVDWSNKRARNGFESSYLFYGLDWGGKLSNIDPFALSQLISQKAFETTQIVKLHCVHCRKSFCQKFRSPY